MGFIINSYIMTPPTFIDADGGTESTSGNYKIHKFSES